MTTDELARDADRPVAEVSSVIADWPGVFRDDQARVVGFWGLGARADGAPPRGCRAPAVRVVRL